MSLRKIALDEGLQYVRVPRHQSPPANVATPQSSFVAQLRREQDKLALLRLTTGINHVAQASDHHTDMITRVTYAPQQRVYVSGGRDGTVRTWSAVTLSPQRHIQNSNKVLGARWVTDLALPEDNGPTLPLAVLSYDRSISLYDATRSSMDMVGRVTHLEVRSRMNDGPKGWGRAIRPPGGPPLAVRAPPPPPPPGPAP